MRCKLYSCLLAYFDFKIGYNFTDWTKVEWFRPLFKSFYIYWLRHLEMTPYIGLSFENGLFCWCYTYQQFNLLPH